MVNEDVCDQSGEGAAHWQAIRELVRFIFEDTDILLEADR